MKFLEEIDFVVRISQLNLGADVEAAVKNGT